MNDRLRVCPTCKRPLDDANRQRMGLRTGETLNRLCPGLNGPSDIDHVLHNGRVSPERLFFLEYKGNGGGAKYGQAFLFRSVTGDWEERTSGRLLSIRYQILPEHPSEPEDLLSPIVSWMWPEGALLP
jgi:hypothetical protein